jgi:hypothetical protein
MGSESIHLACGFSQSPSGGALTTISLSRCNIITVTYSSRQKYGFLHTFKASQILLMRGDFLHAGMPLTVPRGHMKFYPQPEAGWKLPCTFWNRKNSDRISCLWQGAYPPCAYPFVHSPDLGGQFVVSYPVRNTMLLCFPFTPDECKVLGIDFVPPGEFDKEDRAKLKKTLSSQLNMGIYNV